MAVCNIETAFCKIDELACPRNDEISSCVSAKHEVVRLYFGLKFLIRFISYSA